MKDRNITVATAGSCREAFWQNEEISWYDFVERLKHCRHTEETAREYKMMSPMEKSKRKDVGGFVGGKLKGNLRQKGQIEYRDLIALDLDDIKPKELNDLLDKLDKLDRALFAYYTHSTSEEKPKLRVIIPLEEGCTEDEYEPISRKIAEYLGMAQVDPKSFSAVQLMFYPSLPKDISHDIIYHDKDMLKKQEILNKYEDWKDCNTWPRHKGDAVRLPETKAEDPLSKDGWIGAFCREYSVQDVIALHLSEVYEKTTDGRYSYTKGSTANGAVVYGDGRWWYSNHATDPAGGKLLNAFDLVRIHKFGDDKESTDRMFELVYADERVKERYFKETEATRAELFTAVEEVKTSTADNHWKSRLDTDKKGNIRATSNNVLIILLADPALQGKLFYDEFAEQRVTMGAMPWDKTRVGLNLFSDSDFSGLQWYINNLYVKVTQNDFKIAIDVLFQNRRRNALKEYLERLPEWDGVERIGTLYHDYLGAEANKYTAMAARKALTAAVMRVFNPGTKFDYMTIFQGKQGIGKSTLLAKLGMGWFNDSITSFEGKDAAELIQNSWIIEIGEMRTMKNNDINVMKQFLTKQEDIYRPAYGREPVQRKRKCVFFGTTNEDEFLKDITGARRFWVIEVKGDSKKKPWDLEQDTIDQIWAEAKMYQLMGEKLCLDRAEEDLAERISQNHTMSIAFDGLIKEFIERKIPEDWSTTSINSRLSYWSFDDNKKEKNENLVKRDRICAVEVYVEALGGDLACRDKLAMQQINEVIARLGGWTKSVQRCGPYGLCKCFARDVTTSENG